MPCSMRVPSKAVLRSRSRTGIDPLVGADYDLCVGAQVDQHLDLIALRHAGNEGAANTIRAGKSACAWQQPDRS